MVGETHAGVPFLLAFFAAYAATPVAIRIARRTAFYDYPQRYKAHPAPIPYLGGAAVLAGFAIGATSSLAEWRTTLPILAGALSLWFVGTLDDRRTVGPWKRVIAAVGAATLLWATGLGWEVSENTYVSLAVTALWVVSIVNAFNLMDNVDGAASAVAAVVAAAAGVLALLKHTDIVATLALALCGACVAFLKFNLRARGAKIFLGDGGSMPVGFVIAAVVMSLPLEESLGWRSLVPAMLLVGLPIFDTALVIVSRRRRGAIVWRGARDHLTHRLLPRLGSTKALCAVIASIQALISSLAVFVAFGGWMALLVAGTAGLLICIGAIIALEMVAPVPDVTSASREPTGRLGVRRKLVLQSVRAASLIERRR
jgi:UDP-GlcNAc:undecaprenyl-phosphate GlcNAc-1-phosphate transferase